MSIVVNEVSKSFGKKAVLKNITLTAKEGEIIGLIGPSGAGKTTLIRAITGAIKGDSGEIYMEDIPVPNKALLRQLGFMPQADALYTDLSGIDNLKFFGRLYGLSGKTLNERCDEMLKFMGLYEDRNKLVFNYSGGMKKRLSLIIALLHNPKYLILDEPTVGIDPVLRRKIWLSFSELAKEGKTVMVSTHVMDEAIKCTKCALIYNGEVIAFDTVEKLLSSTQSGEIEELFFNAEEVQK